ncbi:MAG TPA: autotransporter-associated beta strand repeat-containing protein [Phycisphaerae bacterium]|nr:autotransporter-associated beta strand repeat-containing protein [Phycisphaerae bacterium]
MIKSRKLKLVLAVAAAAMIHGASQKTAFATGDTWVANSPTANNWDSPGAWQGNNPPQAGDDLYFNGSGTSVSNNDLNGLSVNSISFRGAYTLTGNSLTMTRGLYIQTELSGVVDTIKLSGIDGQYLQFGTGGYGGYSNGTVAFAGSGNTYTFDADTGLWAQGQTGTATIDAGNDEIEFSGGAYIGTKETKNKVMVKITGDSGGKISFDDTIHLELFGTINFAGAQTTVLSGDNTGPGSLLQTGSGTTTLAGNNDYSGNTVVSHGVLDITGAISASEITVDGGTLTGPGGSVQSVSMDSGAITAHDADNPTGTLSINSLTTSGGTLEFNVGKESVVDLIKVSGVANLGSATGLQFYFAYIKGAGPIPGENVAILSAQNLKNQMAGFTDGVGKTVNRNGMLVTPYIGGSKPVGDANPGTNPNTIYVYVSSGK